MCKILGLIAIGLLSAAQGQAEPDPLVKAARERQNAVKSLVLEFKRVDFDPANGRTAGAPEAIKNRVPGTGVPSRDTTSESTNRVLISGGKMRYENNHPNWFLPTGRLQYATKVTTYNGHVLKALLPKGFSGDEVGAGRIQPTSGAEGFRDPLLNPIMISFRGLDLEHCAYPATSMKATGMRVPVKGDVCAEYSLAIGNLVVNLLMDTTKKHALRRIRKLRNNHLVHQLDAQWRKDDQWGWLPTSWVMREYTESGSLLKDTRVDVVSIKLNVEIPEELFEIQFPPDAWVYDTRVNKTFKVQPDGTMHEVSSSGKDLGKAAVPQTEESFVRRHKWLLFASAVLLIGLVGWRVGVRRSRRATQAST